MLTFELPVALPDHVAVLVSAVPYLGTVVFPTSAADDLCRKWTQAVVMPPSGFTDCHLRLHLFPLVRINDRRVALFHYVLRDLALVHLHLLGKEIHGELLLQDRAALVLLVRQDALNGAALPYTATREDETFMDCQLFSLYGEKTAVSLRRSLQKTLQYTATAKGKS